MNDFLSKLPGPYFDFLVVTNGEYWERAGKARRVIGIKREYFHHPDALRVSDAIIGLVSHYFQKAHPSFNYYGPTEFLNENLNELLNSLAGWVERNRSCKSEAEFRGLLNDYFLEEAQTIVESWDDQWPIIRDELSANVLEIYNRGRVAKRERKVLLVLGV
jgi:hypothetical protein